MSDKAYTLDGKTFQVLREADGSLRVEKTKHHLQTEAKNIDHQTKKFFSAKPNKLGLFWVYSHKNKRVLSWPGGSMELEALDLTEASAGSAGSLKPLKLTMPGKVLSVKVKEGDTVEPGQALVVVEAMKMENQLLASSKAKISKLHIKTGDRLESGAILITFEPA